MHNDYHALVKDLEQDPDIGPLRTEHHAKLFEALGSHAKSVPEAGQYRLTQEIYRMCLCPSSRKKQTVAEHSCNVATLALIMFSKVSCFSDTQKLNILSRCLLHDADEVVSMDIPYHAKLENKDIINDYINDNKDDIIGVNALQDIVEWDDFENMESIVVRMLDSLELLIYAYECKIIGEELVDIRSGKVIFDTCHQTLQDFADPRNIRVHAEVTCYISQVIVNIKMLYDAIGESNG